MAATAKATANSTQQPREHDQGREVLMSYVEIEDLFPKASGGLYRTTLSVELMIILVHFLVWQC